MNNFWGWTVMDPDSVNNEQWQEFVEVYVNDKYDMQMKEFFEKNNPYALAQMIERIVEAERKEYFQTDAATMEKLTETYLEMANKYDIYSDNELFKEELENLAQGFGLDFKLPEKMSQQVMDIKQQSAVSEKANENASEFVTGQKLEKQSEQEIESDNEVLWVSLVCLFLMLLGSFYQVRFRSLSY
jgi:cobaltochelatase CobN